MQGVAFICDSTAADRRSFSSPSGLMRGIAGSDFGAVARTERGASDRRTDSNAAVTSWRRVAHARAGETIEVAISSELSRTAVMQQI